MGKLKSWKRKRRANRSETERFYASGWYQARKSYMAHLSRMLSAGYTYFEHPDNRHICKLNYFDPSALVYISGTSLFNGQEMGIEAKSVYSLTPQQANERVDYYHRYGTVPYMVKYIYEGDYSFIDKLPYIGYITKEGIKLLAKDYSGPLIHCRASSDGECNASHCPQLIENEPYKSGRHCPIDVECYYCGDIDCDY